MYKVRLSSGFLWLSSVPESKSLRKKNLGIRHSYLQSGISLLSCLSIPKIPADGTWILTKH